MPSPTPSSGVRRTGCGRRLRPSLLLALLADRTAGRRARHSQAGFSLAVAFLVILTVILGSVALASRTTLGNLSAADTGDSLEARQAAEAGLALVISELNRERNRKLLVTDVPMNSWSSGNTALQNPCLVAAGTSPTNQAINLANNTVQNVTPGDTSRQFVLNSLEVKNVNRARRFRSTSSGAGSGGTFTPNAPATDRYNTSLINLGAAPPIPPSTAATPNIGFLEVSVEGRFRGARATLTREYQLVPKCCQLSFGSGQPLHGADTRSCDPSFPRVLVGISGGGLTATPGSQIGVQNSATGAQPDEILCVTNLALCPGAGGSGTTASVDGVPVTPINIDLPEVPNYLQQIGGICPTGQDCTIGAVIRSDSTASKDYLRVNAAGNGVELCNANNVNTLATTNDDDAGNLALSTTVADCTSAGINEFCAKSTNGIDDGFHCRISRLTVCDDTSPAQAGNTNCGADSPLPGTSEANRINNNSFIIDTSGAPIYLYFNEAWNATGVDLIGGFDDGQIVHVSCDTVPGPSQACSQSAPPDDSSKAVFYSDKDIEIRVGDDGFIRDLFMYLPEGKLFLRSDNNNEDETFTPNYTGSLWVNDLEMGLSNRPNYLTQLFVPPNSNSFFLPPGFPLPLFDWVARSTTSTSLF